MNTYCWRVMFYDVDDKAEDVEPLITLPSVPVPQKGDRVQWQELRKGLHHGVVVSVSWYFDELIEGAPRYEAEVMVRRDKKVSI